MLRGARASNSSSLREIPHHLMKAEVHYRIHKSLPLDRILSQINPFVSPYAVTRPLFDARTFYEASHLWILRQNVRQPATLSPFVHMLRVPITPDLISLIIFGTKSVNYDESAIMVSTRLLLLACIYQDK